MKKTFSFLHFSILLLLCTAVLSTGIFLYVNRLSTFLHQDMKTYLSEVAKQGVNTIEAKVQDDLDLLTSIASAIGSLPDPTESMITNLMKAESKTNNFKRMGFVYPDGMAVLSDDLLLDISQENHFQKALHGVPNVSNLITDASDGENIIVEAVPVYHQDRIIGVLFATRSTEEYAKALDVESFGGEGYSVIIRSNGDKIVRAEHKNAVSGMYNIFDTPDDPQQELAHNIQRNLQQGISGTIDYYSKEKGPLHISYEPLRINDWYLFSVVPTGHLTAQVNTFITLLLILCLSVAAAGLIIWGYVFLQQRRNKKKLFAYAYIDPITGFPNAEANRSEVERLLAENPNEQYAIIAMDVSKFKIFNEQHGYNVGNILLKHIAQVIQNNLQAGECSTRMYGDYFGMLLKYETKGSLKNRLKLLGEQITSFQTENCQTYPLVLSFGVYLVEDRSMPLRVMYNRATVAKSRIKGRYDEVVSFYQPRWQQKLEEEAFIEQHMQDSIQKKEFHFFIEPIVSLSGGKIGAGMALAKWMIPDHAKPLYMSEFLPVFQKNGFIYQFDKFLFETACQTISYWGRNGLPMIPLVINLSNELFYEPNFVKKLIKKPTEYGLENKWLIIELTETTKTDFLPQLKQAGEELRKAGFGLTVRYKGKGVTLANIFQHLPIEGIKAAPSVWERSNDPKQNVITKSLIDICKQLDIFLAADGIESEENLTHVKQLGFQYAQGPAVAAEMTIAEVSQKLTQQNGPVEKMQ